MTLAFDMHRIGRNIAALRRERNMTQMQLADEMSVSFQAVSNWERGQSMPDVSKLPELAELFGTTVDQLLGRKSAVIDAALSGTLAETPVAPAELAEAAPLLPPDQVDAAVNLLTDLPVEDVPLTSLLPFLSEDKVDQIARAKAERGQDICELLPFMTEDTIDEIARNMPERGQDICELLPFMTENAIDEIARNMTERGQDICELLPFMTDEAIDEVAIVRLKRHQPIDDMMPFVSEALLDRLADLLS